MKMILKNEKPEKKGHLENKQDNQQGENVPDCKGYKGFQEHRRVSLSPC